MINHWPPNEQPREKLLLHGAQNLSDAELIAIFLRCGIKGKTAIDLAREILQKLGGLRGLFKAKLQDFSQIKGLGKVKYVQIQATLAIAQRYLEQNIKTQQLINNAEATKNFLRLKMRDLPHEVFAGLFLDSNNRLIAYEQLFNGTVNTTAVHPREVLKRALFHNATAIIIAHNHPSGCAKPSQQDKHLTEKLQQALDLIDITLHDHLIIGDNQFFSFAEYGLI